MIYGMTNLTYIPAEGIIKKVDFLKRITRYEGEYLVENNKGVSYYNLPSAFDIEVSSFYENGEKRGTMYIWQFGIDNMVTTGRTWEQFILFLSALRLGLNLGPKRRLVVYVHNLAYEFQFIRKWIEWDKVFSLEERKVLYALSDGIEFRCSLRLAGGKSLDNVAKDLQKYKIKKMVGDLDYTLIRHSKTILTEKELKYCENDIRVLLHYIQEKIETDGSIINIPLTNTGYVRNYTRKKCLDNWNKYREIMNNLTMDPSEFSQLKRAFMGGFTHANARYVDKVVKDVGSHDLISSYPAVMVLEKFPMSKAHYIGDVTEQEFIEYSKQFCCMCELELWDVCPKFYFEHAISASKCYIQNDIVTDNGRVVFARCISLTITEQDYYVYKEFYEWEICYFRNLRMYEKQYLPTQFVLSILDLYQKKTYLKGIPGEEINYMISKNMINADYGMVVTNPVRDIIEYTDNMFTTTPANVYESIEKYNKSVKRFLFYPWGVWVTAYARANLFSAILSIGEDYIYSDTDSVKTRNTEKHESFFERYNAEIIRKINKSAKYHKIDESMYWPKTKTGKKKIIGIWESERGYDKFKTLGAKRYLVQQGGEFELTLAGSNKRKGATFLAMKDKPFDSFSNELTIPPEYSGRIIFTYIDDETEGGVTDYNGVTEKYRELSSVHMENSEYTLGRTRDFIRFLNSIEVLDYE